MQKPSLILNNVFDLGLKTDLKNSEASVTSKIEKLAKSQTQAISDVDDKCNAKTTTLNRFTEQLNKRTSSLENKPR